MICAYEVDNPKYAGVLTGEECKRLCKLQRPSL